LKKHPILSKKKGLERGGKRCHPGDTVVIGKEEATNPGNDLRRWSVRKIEKFQLPGKCPEVVKGPKKL